MVAGIAIPEILDLLFEKTFDKWKFWGEFFGSSFGFLLGSLELGLERAMIESWKTWQTIVFIILIFIGGFVGAKISARFSKAWVNEPVEKESAKYKWVKGAVIIVVTVICGGLLVKNVVL